MENNEKNGMTEDKGKQLSERTGTARLIRTGAVISAILLLISGTLIPVFAWLHLGRNVAGYAPISSPESLYIGTGNEEDIRYLYFTGIDRSGEGYVDYVICVSGEGITKYDLQLGYTTNNENLYYSIYPAEEYTGQDPAPQDAVRYVSYRDEDDVKYYTKTSADPLSMAPFSAALSLTYDEYTLVDAQAEPVYQHTTSPVTVGYDLQEFVHYYILRISWEQGVNERETDIICISAKA